MKLCDVLKLYRWAAKLGLRELAAEIGLSASTLSRIEGGEVPNGSGLAKLLCWLIRQSDGPAITPPAGEEEKRNEPQ